MYALMIYSLKAGACLAVFYLFFKLLLSRETFHRLNRIVVLGAMVLSFVLPLCVVTIERELPVLPDFSDVTTQVMVPAVPLPEPFPWDEIAGAAFILGAIATLFWTLWSLVCVLRLVWRGHREKLEDGSVLVRMQRPVTPFSWGRYIVISEEDYAESGCEIVIHERAHLRLRHSFDLLLTDIVGCLQWFNPAMWLLRRELRAIHEYEADEAVLDSGVDAKRYQLMLIKKAAGGRWYSVANSFNHSKLKNRITMMLRKKSSRWACAKALVVVPLTALALGAFAQTAYVFPEDKVNQETVTIRISGTDSVPESAPLYIVDGEEVSGEALQKIGPSRIKLIEVRKDSMKVKYGEKGKNGVVFVTLRKPGETAEPISTDTLKMEDVVVVGYGRQPQTDSLSARLNGRMIAIRTAKEPGNVKKEKIVWLIDGIETDPSKASDLKPEQIGSMSIYKDVTVRMMFPGREDIDGVIEITTKGSRTKVEAALSAGHSGVVSAYQTLGAVREKLTPEEYAKLQKGLSGAIQGLGDASFELGKQKFADGQLSGKVAGVSGLDKAAIYIDGRKASKEELEKLGTDKIWSIKVTKGPDATDQQGQNGISKMILVTTKDAADKDISIRVAASPENADGAVSVGEAKHTQSTSVVVSGSFEGQIADADKKLILIDGEKSTPKKLKRLAPGKIVGVKIIEGGDVVEKYGEDAKEGVIVVTTRK